VVTGASRANYAAASKTYAEQSMKALHDHIAATFEGTVCPMTPSASVLPPDMGARNVPATRAPLAPGGYTEATTLKAKNGKKARKALAADVAAALAAKGVVADAASIASLIDAQLAPVRERYEEKISELAKQVDELGAQPDPAMAPVRGQMARIPATGAAAPVEKRSLIDEARDREAAAVARQAADHADYIGYLERLTKSAVPAQREAAQAELDKIGGAPAAS
jgi:hypothetical protein